MWATEKNTLKWCRCSPKTTLITLIFKTSPKPVQVNILISFHFCLRNEHYMKPLSGELHWLTHLLGTWKNIFSAQFWNKMSAKLNIKVQWYFLFYYCMWHLELRFFLYAAPLDTMLQKCLCFNSWNILRCLVLTFR